MYIEPVIHCLYLAFQFTNMGRPVKGAPPKDKPNDQALILQVLDNVPFKSYLDTCDTTVLAADEIFFFITNGLNKGTAFIYAEGIVNKYITLNGTPDMLLGSKNNIKAKLFNNIRETNLFSDLQVTIGSDTYKGPAIRLMVTQSLYEETKQKGFLYPLLISLLTDRWQVHALMA
jgi:hypothetical protein